MFFMTGSLLSKFSEINSFFACLILALYRAADRPKDNCSLRAILRTPMRFVFSSILLSVLSSHAAFKLFTTSLNSAMVSRLLNSFFSAMAMSLLFAT